MYPLSFKLPLCWLHSPQSHISYAPRIRSLTVAMHLEIHRIYPSSFKLPLCWLHSLTPVT
ncbi:hypothetical protein CKY10_07995 [Photorhabdus sp. HUG-39]|nr:hypothetical protein CKY10_07995 [Photorhabdus sp. HUG-39]